MSSINIAQRRIGPEDDVFIIAELSCNHLGNKEVALATVQAAKACGANAIKLQTFTADTITLRSEAKDFQIQHGTLWDGLTLHKLYEEAHTPWEWHAELQRAAHQAGLLFFSSPFDPTAVDFLESLHVPAYKVASFEITDIPLIEHIASKGKPVIISTGIAELTDIEEAVRAVRRMGNDQIALLKCTSTYPAPIEEANLRTIPDMASRFGVVTGVSDHTLGAAVPVAAVCMGASIVEKHLILDKKLGGHDVAFSLDPTEFKAMVVAVRDAQMSLGRVSYELSEKSRGNRVFARSLYACADIKCGELLTKDNVRSVRPAFGLPPKELPRVLGAHARCDISYGTALSWELLKV